MSAIDGLAAAATLRGFAPLKYHGACLYYVWLAVKAHGATSTRTYQTAYEAWGATTRRHTDHNPPAGVVVWLGRRNDGDMAGDVFFSLGGGRAIATDQPTWGLVGECTIAERMLTTRRAYLGWTEDFLGNTLTGVTTAATDVTPIIEQEHTDMTIFYQPTNNSSPLKDGTSRIWAGSRTIGGIDYADVWGVADNGDGRRLTRKQWVDLYATAQAKNVTLPVITCTGNELEQIIYAPRF